MSLGVPLGLVIGFDGDKPPSGWKFVHGQKCSTKRGTYWYPVFKAIGYAWGGYKRWFYLPKFHFKAIMKVP